MVDGLRPGAARRLGSYFYVAYTSTINSAGTDNNVFVARSTSPSGPFAKWDGSGWTGSPRPIVTYTGTASYYGYGEPSLVLMGGKKLYVYCSDDEAEQYTNVAVVDDATVDEWPTYLDPVTLTTARWGTPVAGEVASIVGGADAGQWSWSGPRAWDGDPTTVCSSESHGTTAASRLLDPDERRRVQLDDGPGTGALELSEPGEHHGHAQLRGSSHGTLPARGREHAGHGRLRKRLPAARRNRADHRAVAPWSCRVVTRA